MSMPGATRPTVGIAGTGRMGSAMARALARAGFELVVQNRDRGRAERLATELGARVAASPADLAGQVDVSLTMLADDTAVAAVYGGPGGILAGARAGSILVDMSTVTPAAVQLLEGRARAAGAGILDAPVSGSVSVAEAGQLTLMVGGKVDDLERARPVLDALAKTIFHLGPLGTGNAMKLAVNTVIFGLSGAIAEGLVLAEAAGIDCAVAYDVIAASAAGSPFIGYKRGNFVEPETTPTSFALALAEKDLGLIAELADRVGVQMPQARTNLEVIRAAEDDVGRDVDFAAVAGYLRNLRQH